MIILYAEDDPEDFMLTKEALEEAPLCNDLRRVEDGQELLDYLRREGPYDEDNAPWPVLILLDLNMPRKGGRQAIQEIKADPQLRHIPLVVLTTSRGEEEVFRSYELGASSFITKPVTFEGLVEAMKTLQRYWLKTVQLPEVKPEIHA